LTPLTVTPALWTFVVPFPATFKMFEDVSVTAPVLVTTRVLPTVVVPKVVECLVPVVVVVRVVPTVPDTSMLPADVRVDEPLLSRIAVNAVES